MRRLLEGNVSTEQGRTAGSERLLVAERWRRSLRVVISAHALAAFAQSVLAGAFLDGHFGMLRLHRLNAIWGVVGLSYVQVVLAWLYWRRGGGKRWPLQVSAGLAIVESVEVMLGLGRVIGLHVPLGVTIITANVLLVAWAWWGDFGARR